MHRLQVRENVVGFEKVLGAGKVINKVKFNTGLRACSTDLGPICPFLYTAKSPNLKTRKIILFQDSKSCFRIYNLGSIARKLSRQDFDNLENKIQNLETKILNLENKI